MSVCAHDPRCPGYGPDHHTGPVALEGFAPASTQRPPFPPKFPPMEELLDARVILRKQVKSGHPARRSMARLELDAVERIIADAKRASGKSEADYV